MREIKFRAWHKADKKIYEVIAFNLGKWFLRGKAHPMPRSAVELLQYTGLKDKNGVEIYEGDILKSDDKYNEIVSVVWNHGQFQLRLEFKRIDVKGQEYTHHANIKIYPHRYIVIGNIYEHPHLLEVNE